MEGRNIVESGIVIIILNVILSVYLQVVHRGSTGGKKGLLKYSYAACANGIIEVIAAIVLRENSGISINVMYVCYVMRQVMRNIVYYMLMRYIGRYGRSAGGGEEKIDFAQKVMLGVFIYFEMLGMLTGSNYYIEGGEIRTGILEAVLSGMFVKIWIIWGIVEALRAYMKRHVFTMGQFLGILGNYIIILLAGEVTGEYKAIINDIMIALNAYYYFFLLEVPSYRELERVLERLKRVKAAADSARDEAVAADAAKGIFLSNMSHEIRTPLTVILGMNEVIQRKFSGGGEIYERSCDIASAATTLLHIINDILDFTKIESGQLELALRNYDLGRVLKDVDNMVRIRAEQKGLKYLPQIDTSLPEELFGDRIRVHQILVNILNNAVKYTKKGSVKFTLTGVKGDDPSLIVLHITVTDTGIGIHTEDIPKLFKSFSRIDAKETHNIEGTGLGLAITGRLIELMGGTVEVTSTYGMGSTFHVVIPQKIVGTKTIHDYEIEETHKKKEERKILIAPEARILIVDDNDMNRVVLRSLMKENKVKIDEAESGEECLKKIAKNYYDIILMDYMMPQMDGKETMKRIKEMKDAPGAKAKIIVCTANALVGVRAELLSAGFDDFLSKPVNGKELEEMLSKYIPQEKIHQSTGE